MNDKGFSLVETLVAVGLLLVTAAIAVHTFRAYVVEAHLLAAGRAFRTEFRKARSMAVRANVQTAIRFERGPEGSLFSLYSDGDGDGVLGADILAGIDRRVAGPLPLTAGAPGVRVGINPGLPAPPPEHGLLDTADPIRFGVSDMLSFSPLGTATPGTFYLAGEGAQAAVRVTGGSARVRLLVCRGGRWVER